MTLNDTTPGALLEAMMLVRTFEEQNWTLTAQGNAPGTCTSIAQEAAAVGVIKALDAGEQMTCAAMIHCSRSKWHVRCRGRNCRASGR